MLLKWPTVVALLGVLDERSQFSALHLLALALVDALNFFQQASGVIHQLLFSSKWSLLISPLPDTRLISEPEN